MGFITGVMQSMEVRMTQRLYCCVSRIRTAVHCIALMRGSKRTVNSLINYLFILKERAEVKEKKRPYLKTSNLSSKSTALGSAS